MVKRIATEVHGKFKIFNLLVDLPFFRIYQMVGLKDHQVYILIDFDSKTDPHELQNEMRLWRKNQDLFPSLTQSWEMDRVLSLITPQIRSLSVFKLISEDFTVNQEERCFNYLPPLIKLFIKIRDQQIAFSDLESFASRLYYENGNFKILPAALYYLDHRQDPFPKGLKTGEKNRPETALISLMGSLLVFFAAGEGPLMTELPESFKDHLSDPAFHLMDALFSGKMESFESVQRALDQLVLKDSTELNERLKKGKEALAPPQETESALRPEDQAKKAADFTLFGRFLGFFVQAIVFAGQLFVFVFFLIGTYYLEKAEKLGKISLSFFRWLLSLRWQDVKDGLAQGIRDIHQDIARYRASLAELIPIGDAEILNFTRSIGILLKAGVPLARSLLILKVQTDNRRLREAVEKIYLNVVGKGTTLAAGMAVSPKVFSGLYQNMVATGEMSGKVDIALERIAAYLESINRLKRKLKSAATYPVIIALACVGFFAFFVYIILPKFIPIFEGLSLKLPWPTRVLIGLVGFAHSPAMIAVTTIVVVMAFFPIRAFLSSMIGKERLDLAKLKIPVFGPIYKKVLLARFCSTLGSLMDCGIPLLAALEATGKASGNEFFQQTLFSVVEEARVGTQLHVILGGIVFFPKLLIAMLKVGEQTGQVGRMLSKLSEIYEEDVILSLQQFVALLEPMLVTMMGVVAGFVVVAIFLPVYAIVAGIH